MSGRGRTLSLAGALAAALATASAGCASSEERPPDPEPRTTPETEPVAAPPAAAPLDAGALEEKLRARLRERANRALACWSGQACADQPPPPLELAPGERALLGREPETPAERRLRRTLAGLLLDEAAAGAPAGGERLTFAVDGAPYLLDDVRSLLVEAPPARRDALLAEAADAGAERRRRATVKWDEVAARARALGRTRAELVAARAGLSVDELRAAAGQVLNATADWVAGAGLTVADLPAALAEEATAVDGGRALSGPLVDVTPSGEGAAPLPAVFLLDPPREVRFFRGHLEGPAATLAERFARGAARAAALTPEGEAADPVFVAAVGHLARSVTPRLNASAAAASTLARVLRLRAAAVSALATLPGQAKGGALDRWAGQVVGGEPAQGGALLLDVDPAGRAGEGLLGLLAAYALGALLERELGAGWPVDAGARERAAAVLVRAQGIWAESGLEGLVQAAGAGSVEELVRARVR